VCQYPSLWLPKESCVPWWWENISNATYSFHYLPQNLLVQASFSTESWPWAVDLKHLTCLVPHKAEASLPDLKWIQCEMVTIIWGENTPMQSMGMEVSDWKSGGTDYLWPWGPDAQSLYYANCSMLSLSLRVILNLSRQKGRGENQRLSKFWNLLLMGNVWMLFPGFLFF
jgi:hypothetical protein